MGISVAAVVVAVTSALTVALWLGVTPSSVMVVVGGSLARRSDSLSLLETERGERVVMVISMLGRTVVLSSVSTLLEVTMAPTLLAWLPV